MLIRYIAHRIAVAVTVAACISDALKPRDNATGEPYFTYRLVRSDRIGGKVKQVSAAQPGTALCRGPSHSGQPGRINLPQIRRRRSRSDCHSN